MAVRFAPAKIPGPPGITRPAISNIKLACLSDERLPDILATDMRSGQVMALCPRDPEPRWRLLAKLGNPCHIEVVDLDGDGVKDLLVADLGSFPPTDLRCGRVTWLRGNADGKFTPITLLEDVGRVADVRAADFRGTGKLDLVVASFGWNTIGQILYLENQTTDWSQPKFAARVLDQRHGAIHVPVADVNGDGKLDFVALLAQEHEAVVAFLGDGHGGFTRQRLYAAPHPAYGSSGIQLVDLDGDGDLDVLYTNGDVLDSPYLLKPYHGVQWLENPGATPPPGSIIRSRRSTASIGRLPPTSPARAARISSRSASCPARSSRSGRRSGWSRCCFSRRTRRGGTRPIRWRRARAIMSRAPPATSTARAAPILSPASSLPRPRTT